MSLKQTRIKVEDYYHPSLPEFLNRIENTNLKKINLCGFGEIMKWLSSILREAGYEISVCDTREKYFNYECSDLIVKDIKKCTLSKDTLIVLTSEDPSEIKNHIKYILEFIPKDVPVIYDTGKEFNPLRQDKPYKEIINKAEQRAKSMINDKQLFDLIQLVKLTRKIEGKVVEYGSLHGGSGAVLAEALNHYGIKDLYLFDTFAGIPKSEYGVDYRWTKSFSNNSYSEVKDAFADLKNVNVVKGNIKDTHKNIEGPFSFAYIASDTYESGKYLMEYVWPRLNSGGIVHTCDYGSYPNCLPLTKYLDEFENSNPDVISYRTALAGIYFVKP